MMYSVVFIVFLTLPVPQVFLCLSLSFTASP
jgi:hypothetical protein